MVSVQGRGRQDGGRGVGGCLAVILSSFCDMLVTASPWLERGSLPFSLGRREAVRHLSRNIV